MNRNIIGALVGIAMTLTASAQQPVDRTQRPSAQPVPKLLLPEIQKGTLDNGLAVWLVEQHKLPYVACSLVVQTGADRDPAGKAGLAALTAETMDAGTATQDALAISDRLNFIGASLSIRAGVDGSFASLGTLSKHLDEALAVFADVLAHATFPAAEVERLRKQRLTSLMQQKDRAATTASLAFNRIVYGTDHPYGTDPSGTPASIGALTREDLVSFYSTYYRPNNATLVIVGDVTMKDMVARLNKALAGWKPAPVPSAPARSIPGPGPRTVFLIDKPAAPQSEIRIGAPAAPRNTPDFFALTVMNRILGGQFSSRINMNLRERHGYTYGARSVFSFSKEAGPFVASGGFVTGKTDSAVHELLREIDGVFKEGITDEELGFSKRGLTGSFAQGFETPMQIAGNLQTLVLYGLPDNYYASYLPSISNVTGSEVRAAARKYLDTMRMAIVIVGDVHTIKPGLEKLGLGKIVMCDSEGNPL